MGRPMEKNPITYEQVKVLRDRGMSIYAIAKELGCSEYLVESRLDKQDIKRNAHMTYKDKVPRCPILTEEIAVYREKLQIGAVVRLSVPDGESSRGRKKARYTVIEKSREFFRAKDEAGHITTMTYKEMLVEERKSNGKINSAG